MELAGAAVAVLASIEISGTEISVTVLDWTTCVTGSSAMLIRPNASGPDLVCVWVSLSLTLMTDGISEESMMDIFGGMENVKLHLLSN